MIDAIKAEFKKLFSVPSTYYLTGVVIVLELIFGFYVSGWRISNSGLHMSSTLAGDVTGAISIVSIFAGLMAVFLFTHEYRYNTIMYTLTSSNSRTKVLVAKILVVSCFAVAFTAIFGAMSPLLSIIGIDLHHLKLVPQVFNYNTLIWHTLFYGWGYSMAALVIAALVRNQIAAIVILLIAPETIEGLLGLILKKNVVYLPFSSLHQVIGQGMNYNSSISAARGALVFGCYLIVTWLIAWILFLRRDAN